MLPLALALLEVLLVERGGNVYGLPLASIEEAVTAENVLTLEGRPALELRGSSVQLADLADLIGATAPPLPRRRSGDRRHGGRAADRCHLRRLLGKDEVVVKTLGPLLASPPATSARRFSATAASRCCSTPRRSHARATASPGSRPHPLQRARRASRRRSSSSRTRSPSASSSAASSRPPAIASRSRATAARGSTACRPTPRSIS